jgi:glycerol-3-phosphate acyltransferase PlsY
VAAIAGYLLGSVSFARLTMRLAAPGRVVGDVRREVEGSTVDFEAHKVSATAIREQLGTRFGCLTAILDASKGAVVALAFLMAFPDTPYYLIAAAGAIVGHILPVYHRFRGGGGLSTIYGTFLVVDWVGVVATTIVALVAGIAAGKVLVIRWSGIVLMIPWLWWRTGDPWVVGFAIVANLLFWAAMVPELRQVARFRTEATLPDEQAIAELLGMGSFWARVSPYSIPSMLGRHRHED